MKNEKTPRSMREAFGPTSSPSDLFDLDEAADAGRDLVTAGLLGATVVCLAVLASIFVWGA